LKTNPMYATELGNYLRLSISTENVYEKTPIFYR
jgi:hypothetical protein